MNLERDLRSVAAQFKIDGEFYNATPCGSGHINDTYCAAFENCGRPKRYVLQRINHIVFKKPVLVMENIQRVTAHLAKKVADKPDANRRVLTLIPARSGMYYFLDEQGNFWRVYRFIEKARSYDTVESPRQAFEVARAYGRFQRLLADLPPPPLHETIRDFHHTPKRCAALLKAIEKDEFNRAALARNEVDFALKRASIADTLLRANLPERVTHNDTKFNNVLLDDVTGEGICIVDLDTIMPGLALCDFGDMVRSTTSPAREDERDLSLVRMQFPMFEALVRGYLSEAGDFLTAAEKKLLAFSGKLIAFETGVRFLSDFLSGDTYFKVHHDGHNLDRCRTQFKLVRSIEEQEEQMNELVELVSRQSGAE